MRRAALYCRVSSAASATDDPWASLPRQEERLRQIAERDGAGVALVYQEVYTGVRSDRPEFSDLLRRLEAREVQVVYVVAFDRLTRNGDLAEVEQLRREFVRLGCDVITPNEAWRFSGSEADSPENKLNFRMRGVISGFERDLIERRMREGREKKARSGGDYGAPTPYGYRVTWDAQTGRKSFEVDDEQAAVVRRIYSRYLEGAGYATIARELNAQGVNPPNARRWTAAHVGKVIAGRLDAVEAAELIREAHDRGESPKAIAEALNASGVPLAGAPGWDTSAVRYILRNAAYAGLTEYLKPWRRHRLKSQSPTEVVASAAYPAVVDVATMQAVRERMETRRTDPRREVAGQHPLSGILRCNGCGIGMVISHNNGRNYYKCRSLSDTRVSCPAPERFRYERANAAVLESLRRALPELVADGLARQAAPDLDPAEQRELDAARRRLAALEQEEVNFTRLLAQQVVSLEAYQRSIKPVQEEQRTARATIDRLEKGARRRRSDLEFLAGLGPALELLKAISPEHPGLRGLFASTVRAVILVNEGRDPIHTRQRGVRVARLQLITGEWWIG